MHIIKFSVNAANLANVVGNFYEFRSSTARSVGHFQIFEPTS